MPKILPSLMIGAIAWGLTNVVALTTPFLSAQAATIATGAGLFSRKLGNNPATGTTYTKTDLLDSILADLTRINPSNFGAFLFAGHDPQAPIQAQ